MLEVNIHIRVATENPNIRKNAHNEEKDVEEGKKYSSTTFGPLWAGRAKVSHGVMIFCRNLRQSLPIRKKGATTSRWVLCVARRLPL